MLGLNLDQLSQKLVLACIAANLRHRKNWRPNVDNLTEPEKQILRICIKELIDTGHHWSDHWLDDELDAFHSVCKKLSITLAHKDQQ